MIVYKVINNKTGQIYVGQTCRSLEIRKSEHLRLVRKIERIANPSLLHKAMSEDGEGEFTWQVLEQCTDANHLNDREIFHIKDLKCMEPFGYNQTKGGYMDGDMSQAIRDRIAESVSALHKDPEYQARNYPLLKGLTPPNKGVAMSEEQKSTLSKVKTEMYADPNYVNPNKGQKRTGEALENLHKAYETRQLPTGDAWKEAHGKQYTPEVRAKMRAAKLGKKPANTKKILCIETGQVFLGFTDASNALNICRQSIYSQIKGKLKSAGGLHFKYLD